jgi:hypothetical protein
MDRSEIPNGEAHLSIIYRPMDEHVGTFIDLKFGDDCDIDPMDVINGMLKAIESLANELNIEGFEGVLANHYTIQ